MATITLYRNAQRAAYRADEVGEGWSLEPYGDDTEYYSGETVEEEEFVLPEGHRLGETIYGEPAIYRGDDHCPLVTMQGTPCLCSGGRTLALARA